MRKILVALALAAAMIMAPAASAQANGQDKVTICHAAGLEGTTHYETLTIGYPAVYGPAGHFYENGTPRAGHEQDYLGACEEQPEVEYSQFRFVRRMPFLSDQLGVFEAGSLVEVSQPTCEYNYFDISIGGQFVTSVEAPLRSHKGAALRVREAGAGVVAKVQAPICR